MNRFTPIANSRGVSGGAPGERRYWAFLSYAHADAKAAAKLHLELERFRVPVVLRGKPHPFGVIPRRLTPIFRDRQELAASSDLGREINEALAASNYFIVLCSPAAAKSRWVDQELREFQRLHGRERILAAILDGDPACGDAQRECFPPALREDGVEPIAADLRTEGDGWRGGFLKLVAGMLDIGLDELVQRDQQRRHKRMAWLTAASLAGMAVTSGLAYFAVDARDAAREERRQAEGLVEFMLGDLKGKLEPIGKLEALDGVGARILDYYSRQESADLDDAGLLQRSRALSLTAQVAFSRGDFTGAERLYREALAGTGEAIDRSPNDAQRLFDHAQNVFYLGELARQRGRIDQAESATREYHRLAARMVAIDPTNLRWRMESVYAAENMAIVLINKRRFAEAVRQMDAVLGPMTAIASANPANAEYQREYSTVLSWLADAKRDQGRLAEAMAIRERQARFLVGRLDSGGSNVQLQAQLVNSRRALGNLLTDTGQIGPASAQFRRAIAEANRLIAIEPENATWKGDSATARIELARTLIPVKGMAEAASLTNAACETAASLRERAPNASDWHELQTSCRLMRARLALEAGALPESLALAERALESAKEERNTDAFRPRYRIAAAHRLIGDIRSRMGDSAAAAEAWQAGLVQLPAKVPERPRELELRASLLERLGQSGEVRPMKDRLKKIGFQPQA